MRSNKITVWTLSPTIEQIPERCILSIINQTVKPFEYIILDDCSTDKSIEIALDYASSYSWIKVFQKTI